MIEFFKAPKGTQDVLPNETVLWQRIEHAAAEVCKNFNFNEIRTPTFESEKLFNRSVGDTTDVVEKEMFKFTDLAGRPLALRPEGTASVVRAILEHGLVNEPMPLKFFYFLSCFRNERPQAGRFKEFHQFGMELFGSQMPVADVEVILAVCQFFEKLQVKNLQLEINSIGCTKCRSNYRTKLIDFYENKKDELCQLCIKRLQKNPLRLLDCKNPNCTNISKNAPKMLDNLCDDCKKHFNQLCNMLKHENVAFVINPYVVRGLDYYTRTVFEFQSNELGAQKTVCGGGRYDSLLETLSNFSLPALGCAIGLERLIMLLKAQNNPLTSHTSSCCLHVGFLGNFETTATVAMKIVNDLRKLNLNAEINLLNRSAKAQMKYANKINSIFSCIVGDKEIETGKIQIKNMVNQQTHEINLNNFKTEFLNIWQQYK